MSAQNLRVVQIVAMLRVCRGTGGQHRHKGLSALKFFQRCRSFGFPEYWSKQMPGTVQHEIASYITKRVPSPRLGSHSAKSAVDPQGRRRPIKAHYTMCAVKGTPGSPLPSGDGGLETQEAFLFCRVSLFGGETPSSTDRLTTNATTNHFCYSTVIINHRAGKILKSKGTLEPATSKSKQVLLVSK